MTTATGEPDDEDTDPPLKPSPDLVRAVAHVQRMMREVNPPVLPTAFLEQFARAINDGLNTQAMRGIQEAVANISRALDRVASPTLAAAALSIGSAAAAHSDWTQAINRAAANWALDGAQLKRTQELMLQLRGAMDVLDAEVEPREFTPTGPGTIARPGSDWGISKAAAMKILAWLGGELGATVGVHQLIRDLVGDEPSPGQVLYWSAAIVCMSTIMVLMLVKPSEWRDQDVD